MNHVKRIRQVVKSDYELPRVCLSVRSSSWNNPAPSGMIFMKFYIRGFAKTCRDIKVEKNKAVYTKA